MGTIRDKNKQAQAYDYFISLGYSPQASAGIVGNLDYESGLSTTIEGDKGFKGGSSFGIAQFRGERLDRLKSRYGKDWTSFENQLDYVRHELETTHKRANNILKTTNNVYEAGQAFSDLYEVPAKKYKDNKDRQNKVNSIYSNYSKGTTNVTNLQEIDYTPIFAQQEVIYTPNIEEEKEDKEIEELTKENQEREFVKEYKASIVQQELPQLQEQFQEQAQPQYNLTDIYNQVSQFVDTPIAQRGGTYNNLREDEKNNEKPMLERIPSNRFESQGGQTSAQLRSEKELEEEVGQQGVIKDQQGQRKYPFKVTEIQGNTMATDGYGNIPLLVKPNVGKSQIIEANSGDYKFEGATKFTEFPITEAEKQFLKAYNGLKR